VDGNITSKTLVIQEGGAFSGQSIMDGGAGQAPAGQPQRRAAEPGGSSEEQQAERTRVS